VKTYQPDQLIYNGYKLKNGPNPRSQAKFHSARRQAFATWAEVTGVAMAA
jgi:hypothetical protein